MPRWGSSRSATGRSSSCGSRALSDFFRPEARAALARWREPLIAAALGGLGLWWGLTSFGILRWVGWLLVAAALATIYAALQRMRFSRGGGGAGIVTVDERRIVYFGPVVGGVVDLDLLTRLEIDPAPSAAWLLTTDSAETLRIPVDAEGADQLFDLFAALPGIRTGAVLAAVEHPPETRAILWAAPAPERPRLR